LISRCVSGIDLITTERRPANKQAQTALPQAWPRLSASF